jgi:hypothetical protein
MPIVERDGEFLLGDRSIDDPRLTIHFCPLCGEYGRPDRGNRACECGVMESLVRDYPDLMEFDSKMNEFHILHSPRSGKLQIYYCIACGGNPPESLRHTFFEEPTTSDYDDAWARIANLMGEDDFIREFGEPTHVFDIPPMPEKDIEIYGMKSMKKQWTFEPSGSPISYCLQLMADDSYQKSLGAKHKKTNEA